MVRPNRGRADSRTTKLYDRRWQKVLLEEMERNAELGILQSVFSPASRREALGEHSEVVAATVG